MKITKDTLRLMRADIDAALAPVAAKYGVQIRAGNCSFSELAATFKLEIGTIEAGEVQDRTRAVLMELLPVLGFTRDDLELVFYYGGNNQKFRLWGYNGRSARPLILKRVSDGQKYLATEDAVRSSLAEARGVTAKLSPT